MDVPNPRKRTRTATSATLESLVIGAVLFRKGTQRQGKDSFLWFKKKGLLAKGLPNYRYKAKRTRVRKWNEVWARGKRQQKKERRRLATSPSTVPRTQFSGGFTVINLGQNQSSTQLPKYFRVLPSTKLSLITPGTMQSLNLPLKHHVTISHTLWFLR